ncbi:hypothetical protein D3C80_2171390 [compost metagenome]
MTWQTENALCFESTESFDGFGQDDKDHRIIVVFIRLIQNVLILPIDILFYCYTKHTRFDCGLLSVCHIAELCITEH